MLSVIGLAENRQSEAVSRVKLYHTRQRKDDTFVTRRFPSEKCGLECAVIDGSAKTNGKKLEDHFIAPTDFAFTSA